MTDRSSADRRTSRFVIRSVVAGMAVVAVLCLQATAASAQPDITVSPNSAAAGSTVTISGNVPVSGTPSCPASDGVQLTSSAALFAPDGFGPQATRDASGNFQVQFLIPSSTPAGSYSVGMRCGGGNVGVTASLTVTSGSLANTGSSVAGPLALAGLAVLVLGLCMSTAASALRRHA